MAAGLGTLQEVRELALPQIMAGLEAVARRDAMLALRQLRSVHVAVAPLMIGAKGTAAMDAYEKRLIKQSKVSRPETDDDFADALLSMVSPEDRAEAAKIIGRS